uniref:E5 beta n=1 Tax=human papillomavirus 87 TaxID=120381 RepID=A0A162LT05_9PAPI|nr:E5 beta [human papillomavirus 87]ALT55063.1 E5 beta [human papillomavirus 87]ALT55071.1 E5 beta [human papillomavirus 87]WAB53457.1 E5 BETA [human papillomavirus 87]WAB54126.1 E5 BETA [human papillomavirus 87]
MYPLQVRGPQGGYDIVLFERGDVGILALILLLIAIILILLYIRILHL